MGRREEDRRGERANICTLANVCPSTCSIFLSLYEVPFLYPPENVCQNQQVHAGA